MNKIISYEEACTIERVWDDLDIKSMQIYKDAAEKGNCKLIRSTTTVPNGIEIFVEIPDLGHDACGLYILPHKNDTWVYVAIEKYGEIRSWLQVECFSVEDSLDSIIAKSLEQLNICPQCKKPVPFNEQHQFSFAGRCCKDCLPKMKEKYEQPGWYN